VLEDIAFSADITFQKDAAGESTVVGQFVNESGVARGIGRIHGGRVYAYQADSHEKAQQRGRQDIAHLVDLLSVRPREESVESAHRLYKLALQRGFTRGRRTAQVAAACLYLVCRQDGKPFLLIDFSDALQVNVFTLGAVFLQLAKLLRLEEHPMFAKPVDPSLYIDRFADRLDLGKEMKRVVGTAMRLVASMKRDWIQTGRRPSGICGAALYIAAHVHGEHMIGKIKKNEMMVGYVWMGRSPQSGCGCSSSVFSLIYSDIKEEKRRSRMSNPHLLPFFL
jgi:transcription factor IIIB 90 kDa subunit